MADREILDAVLRLEATNREDHLSLQSQIRGFAGRTIKLESRSDALEECTREQRDALRAVKDRLSATAKCVAAVKAQWRLVLMLAVPVLLGAGGFVIFGR